jgi:hypothetical protein
MATESYKSMEIPEAPSDCPLKSILNGIPLVNELLGLSIPTPTSEVIHDSDARQFFRNPDAYFKGLAAWICGLPVSTSNWHLLTSLYPQFLSLETDIDDKLLQYATYLNSLSNKQLNQCCKNKFFYHSLFSPRLPSISIIRFYKGKSRLLGIFVL